MDMAKNPFFSLKDMDGGIKRGYEQNNHGLSNLISIVIKSLLRTLSQPCIGQIKA